MKMTRRETLLGGAVSLASSALGYMWGRDGRNVVQTYDDVDDVIGTAQNLRHFEFQTHSGWDVKPIDVFYGDEIAVSTTHTYNYDELDEVESYPDTHYVVVMFHGREQRETDSRPPSPDNWTVRTSDRWASPVSEHQGQPIESFGIGGDRVARQFDLSKRFTGLCFELDANDTVASIRHREDAPGGDFETTFDIDFSELV